MQPSARQQELERIYNSRKLTQSANAPPKGHVPHISISDDDHHVTEAIGSYYDHDDERQQSQQQQQSRPLSFMPNRNEVYESRGIAVTAEEWELRERTAGESEQPLGNWHSEPTLKSEENGFGSVR
ncbi:hypothetical protein KC324_g20883 [Hortaea werneckii]|nr:hypothetical protein KC324_g20883 [Hortaea werneckii]